VTERIATALGLIAFIGLVGVGVARRGRATPEVVVQQSLAAARTGSVRDYLTCFGGALRDQMEATRRELGEERFAQSLQRRATQTVGVATSRVPSEPAGSTDVVLRVEQVFRDRNEVQDFVLARRWGRWRIVALGVSNTKQMPIPYGTPVLPPALAVENDDDGKE